MNVSVKLSCLPFELLRAFFITHKRVCVCEMNNMSRPLILPCLSITHDVLSECSRCINEIRLCALLQLSWGFACVPFAFITLNTQHYLLLDHARKQQHL